MAGVIPYSEPSFQFFRFGFAINFKGKMNYFFCVKDLEVRGNVYFHELLVVVWEINYSDMPRLAYFHYDVTVCVEYCASFLAGPHWVLTLIWTR